jgi:5'-nucleotidase
MILISNDDGYQAKGINYLINIVKDYDDVLVCAPDDARSGFACAFSANTPLRLTHRHHEEGVDVWSCNGTPVDCVKMALAELCQETPRMVIGGINHGDNASVNTHYSGTMGVTMEGCMKYIPSMAFSICDYRADADFTPLETYIREMVQRVLRDGLPKGVCLNVNFPLAPAFKGVRICRMSPGTWTNEVSKCHHPRGYDYWWMVGSYLNDEPEAEDTDRWALDNGYVAITPTRIDVTAYEAFGQLKDYEK